MTARSVELAEEARTAMWWFVAFGGLIFTGSLLVAHSVGQRLSDRTIKLAEVAQAIQKGYLTQRAEDGVRDELGTLGLAFNQMTDDLTTLNRTLETQVQERTAELRTSEAHIVTIPGFDETMVVVRDITERKAHEKRLRDLIRSRDEFIASISHELRTPLTAVMGFAELLRDTESDSSPAEQEEMSQLITEQASDIANLQVARVPVDLRAQLAQVIEASREASAHQIRIVGGPLSALGDPARIRQVLRNLMTNAFRYGGKRIEVQMHTDGTRAFLTVCDDGPGVPEEDREAIFGAYERSHTDRGLPGSVGLGLTVSRSLARLMVGDLTYRYDHGTSIFELTLPAANQPTPISLRSTHKACHESAPQMRVEPTRRQPPSGTTPRSWFVR